MGAVVTLIIEKLVSMTLFPLCYYLAKGSNKTEKGEYADKMLKCLETAICNAIWSAWGYSVLKDTVHLPWFMGGSTDMTTAYESTMIGAPFTKFNKSLYEWYLYS